MDILKKQIVQFLIVITLCMIYNPIAATPNVKTQDLDLATWIWNPWQLTEDTTAIFDFLKKKKVNKVYVQIDVNLPQTTYQQFIAKANEQKISVLALAGEAYWTDENKYKEQDIILQWLTTYQQQVLPSERFVGIHFDIEPYQTTNWKENLNSTIESYQQLVLTAKATANILELPLELDIPYWFDEITYNTSYGKGNLFQWIVKNVNSVTIMAYHDTATSIIQSVQYEMTYATRIKKPIIIAVETLQSAEGDSVSFAEEGERYMNMKLSLVQKKYSNYSSFNGFAIHYVDSWMTMKR